MLREYAIFLREAVLALKTTGALFPASRWAAQAMVQPLLPEARERPLRILELGAGTGSVTLRILEQMRPADQLTLCEISPRFMEILKDELERSPRFAEVRAQVFFERCAVQDLPEREGFDVIVCALPFLNFDRATVEEIFRKVRRVSHADTLMTYYEYVGLHALGRSLSPPSRRRRVRDLDSFLGGVFEEHLIARRNVWLNLPPVVVSRLGGMGQTTQPH